MVKIKKLIIRTELEVENVDEVRKLKKQLCGLFRIKDVNDINLTYEEIEEGINESNLGVKIKTGK